MNMRMLWIVNRTGGLSEMVDKMICHSVVSRGGAGIRRNRKTVKKMAKIFGGMDSHPAF